MKRQTQITRWQRAAIIVATLSATLIGMSQAATASVRTQVSAREAYVGQPITVHVQVDGRATTSAPSFPEVKGLDIQAAGAPSRSSQVTIINGRRTENSSVTYAYRVTPRQAGTFVIPAIEVKTKDGTELTRPVRISATTSETGDLMFAEVVGQRESIFVGEPLDVTLKIWLKPFGDRKLGVTLSPDQMWQMISQEQTEWGSFTKTINELAAERRSVNGIEVLRKDSQGTDRNYYLYEIDATMYPKSAGQLSAEDVQIVADYPTRLGKSRDPFSSMLGGSMFGGDPFFNSSPFRKTLTVTGARPIVVQPKVVDVQVAALPTADQPADFRGAVGDYITVTQANPRNVAAGDPITLQIGIRGTGPMELVQSPPLASIPELTKEFKVADEPLAGVVDGDTKFFVTTIRPRNEEVSAVPSIPFSFFDPETQSYRTVYSDPISIEVRPAEQLALTSIVGDGGGTTADSDSSAFQSGLNLNNYSGDSVLKMQSSPAWTHWLGWLLTLPAAMLGTLYVVRNRSNLFTFNPQSSTNIASASQPSEVVETLRARLTKQFDRDIVTDIVRGEESDLPHELQCRIRSLVETCDQAAFAGSSVSLDDLKSQAIAVVADLNDQRNHRKSPIDSCSKLASRLVAATTLRSAVAAMSLCGAMVLWSGVCDTMIAGESSYDASAADRVSQVNLEPWQRKQILAEANKAYETARSCKDNADAKVSYEEATRKYETLVDSGLVNSLLYFNLANAQLHIGETGQAIANYEKAKRLRPWSISIRRNLLTASKIETEELG